jgi:hypothetical protein
VSTAILTFVLLLALARPLQAQHSNGYVFFAPGGITCCGHTAMTLQFGAGGEAVLGKGIGLGAEVGAVGTRRYFADSVVGVFSPNGYYHFVHGKHITIDPFVTGGYTLIFRSGHANLFNVGGGMNYWFRSRLGGRLEFRDQVHTECVELSCSPRDGASVHYWGVRFGLAFR